MGRNTDACLFLWRRLYTGEEGVCAKGAGSRVQESRSDCRIRHVRRSEGLVGTEGRSGLYFGNGVPSLGYILGDEGSAAVLGKRLVGDLLKNQMGDDLKEAFFKEYETSMADIIEKVYRQPFPNRFLAKLSRFCADHIADQRIHDLVYDHFVQFIRRNLVQYKASTPIGFVGSIAYYYRPILEEAMKAEGLLLGTILKDPIEGLKEYHKDVIKPTTE